MTESASVLNAINERLITPRIPVGCFPDEDAVCEEGRQTVEGWADRRTALRTLDAQLLSDRVAKVRRELSYNLDRLGRDLDCVRRGLVPGSDTVGWCQLVAAAANQGRRTTTWSDRRTPEDSHSAWSPP